ncbi:hypothetical protein [Micromonospora sp. CA-111912]|uniref:hypothetical protein n=1 Tax=Micromonospora sp. CA-111912 TaxID=3239955 RepID=UPI003D8C83C5
MESDSDELVKLGELLVKVDDVGRKPAYELPGHRLTGNADVLTFGGVYRCGACSTCCIQPSPCS